MMRHYSQEELTSEQQYKFLSGSVIPRPIAWLTTLSEQSGIINVAPFSSFSIVYKELPVVSIIIMRKNGEQKDSALNLSQTGEGVIHIVDDSLLQEMNQSAMSLEREQSELAYLNVTTVASQRVKVPAIAEAKIRFEGTVYQHIPIYNQAKTDILSDLFIMEVVDFHFSAEVFDPKTEYVNVAALKPVARLAGPYYGVLGSTYQQRPD